MEYQVSNKRLGIAFSRLNIPLSQDVIRQILSENGLTPIEFDLIKAARQCVGSSSYQIGCRMDQAPAIMDCSSFTKWLYEQAGIWLPRLSIQQSERGRRVASLDHLRAGDLVFTNRVGKRSFYRRDPDADIGHVAIATGSGTVIHAKNSEYGVVEVSPSQLLGTVRVIRRYLPVNPGDFQTFCLPAGSEIETLDDIRWLIRSHLGKSIQ